MSTDVSGVHRRRDDEEDSPRVPQYRVNLDQASRRALFAAFAMKGLLSAATALAPGALCTQAVALADMLIEELDKP